MDNREKYRVIIEFYVKNGKDLATTTTDLKNVYGNECPHSTTISRWWTFFRRGGEGTADGSRAGRPLNPVNPRLLKEITWELETDPKISLSALAANIGQPKGYISNIIYTRLDFLRVSAKWVPKILTEAQKQARIRNAKMILAEYRDRQSELIDNLLTVDETWVYYEPTLNQKTAGEWQHPGQRPPEIGRVKNNPKKTMATVFWNSTGVVHIDYLATGKSINSDYYINLLEQVRQKIPKGKKSKVIFLQDNCPAHKSKKTTEKLGQLRWNVLEHPPYSPDLAPSDFYLFRNMKKELLKTSFSDSVDVESKVNAYFDSKPAQWFSRGFEMFFEQLELVIRKKGEYIS